MLAIVVAMVTIITDNGVGFLTTAKGGGYVIAGILLFGFLAK